MAAPRRLLAAVTPVTAALVALLALARAASEGRAFLRPPHIIARSSYVGDAARAWRPPPEVPATGPVSVVRIRGEHVPARLFSTASGPHRITIPAPADGLDLAFRLCVAGEFPPGPIAGSFRLLDPRARPQMHPQQPLVGRPGPDRNWLIVRDGKILYKGPADKVPPSLRSPPVGPPREDHALAALRYAPMREVVPPSGQPRTVYVVEVWGW